MLLVFDALHTLNFIMFSVWIVDRGKQEHHVEPCEADFTQITIDILKQNQKRLLISLCVSAFTVKPQAEYLNDVLVWLVTKISMETGRETLFLQPISDCL